MANERRSEFFEIEQQIVDSQTATIPDDPSIEQLRMDLKSAYATQSNQKLISQEESELNAKIESLKAEIQEVQTVKKERMFDSEVTPEEQIIINKRVKLQQLLFQKYSTREKGRQVERIKRCLEHLREEEITEALILNDNNDDAVICKFTQEDNYLKVVRKSMAIKQTKLEMNSVDRLSIAMTTEQREAYKILVEKRKKSAAKITRLDTKEKAAKRTKLKLDEALEQLDKGQDPKKVFEGWSEARIKAYQQIHTKPNSYYYRFNAPGEKQGSGAWTKEERELFFARLKEVGADGQWGIFSKAIPGRVGYQCSNFYRHLIKTGEVVDPNYSIDENGELHYLFGKKDGGVGTIRVHTNKGIPKELREPKPKKEKQQSTIKTKKRKKNDSDIENLDDEDYSGNFSTWTTVRTASAKSPKKVQDINPLPGFIDPITLVEVERPAISPYGHVMGYDSWMRCLGGSGAGKNICPMTKKPLAKRELVLLTIDNIEDYR